MNILIIGETFSQNLGDAVICKTVHSICENEYPNSHIDVIDLSGRKNYQQKYNANVWQKVYFRVSDFFCRSLPTYDRPRDYNMTLQILRKSINHTKYDVAIFAGGALFTPYFIKRIFKIVNICEKNNIKVVFHACGGG